MKPEAQLVYDGHELHVPTACGIPTHTQLTGTVAENLCELAGRECYDSLGVEHSRGSADFHQHILEVGHLSIYEHFNFTVGIPALGCFIADFGPEQFAALLSLMNRPGLYCRTDPSHQDSLRLTLNLRCILEWSKWGDHSECSPELSHIAHNLAPAIIRVPGPRDERSPLPAGARSGRTGGLDPIDDEERWVTLRLAGSRGFSHEQVRHGDRTAISQRSTRYVDEANSDWCMHPLVLAMMDDPQNHEFFGRVQRFIDESRSIYSEIVQRGSERLMNSGAKLTAVGSRKQARGAARGFLGNALGTSLIFSASVAQWRRMLVMRCHPAADAEIRESAAAALACLKQSAYADRFADMVLVPSPDGLGEVLADGIKA